MLSWAYFAGVFLLRLNWGGEGVYGMVWFWLLGLSASVLAGREAGLPQQLPRPGSGGDLKSCYVT